MKLTSDALISISIPVEDAIALGKKAIFDDLVKQMFDSGLIEIEHEVNGDGRRFYAAVNVYTKEEVDKIDEFIKKNKIKTK